MSHETRSVPDGMSRRHFLGHLKTAALAGPAAQFVGALQARAAAGKPAYKSCVLLWMGGGPSHMDTWSLKPESERNGGEFKPIATSAGPGVEICEHLPLMAKQMHHMSIVRSLNSREGNHDRGSYLMHTGYAPNPTIAHPSFGSVCSYEIGERVAIDLPHFVAINSPAHGAGFLGMAHAPFVVQNPTAPIANLLPPDGVAPARMSRRLQLLGQAENSFLAARKGSQAADHKAVYAKTIRMMNSKYAEGLKLDGVPDPIRDRYGRNSFGQGCLMARRLVEMGVTFVEVSLGGWDNHNDIFDTLSGNLLPQLDKGMSALVEDLAASGLLDTTLVVWMGEFGRTPRINQNGGRDHWPQSWSVVMGGAGLKGGQVVGKTDKDGVEITDRELGVMDLVATMTQAMDIDLSTQFTTPRGRPYKIVDGGMPIAELF
jgi:hypothetical protein